MLLQLQALTDALVVTVFCYTRVSIAFAYPSTGVFVCCLRSAGQAIIVDAISISGGDATPTPTPPPVGELSLQILKYISDTCIRRGMRYSYCHAVLSLQIYLRRTLRMMR